MDRMQIHNHLRNQSRILRRITPTSGRKTYSSDLLMEHMGLTPLQVLSNKTYYNQTLGRIFEGLVLSAFIDLPGFEPGVTDGDMQLCDVVVAPHGMELKYNLADTTPLAQKVRQQRNDLLDEGLNPVALVFRDGPAARRIFNGWELHQGQGCIDYIEKISGQTFSQLLAAHADFLNG
jgi:hypothetical protein